MSGASWHAGWLPPVSVVRHRPRRGPGVPLAEALREQALYGSTEFCLDQVAWGTVSRWGSWGTVTGFELDLLCQ